MEELGGTQKAFCVSHFALALIGPLLSFLPLIPIFEESHLEGFVFTALIVSGLSACFLLERKGLIFSTLTLSFAVYLSDLQTLSLPCLWAAFSVSFMVSTYSWQELKGIFSHFIEDFVAGRVALATVYSKRPGGPLSRSSALAHNTKDLAEQKLQQDSNERAEFLEYSTQQDTGKMPSIQKLREAKSVQDPKIISLQKLLTLTQHQLKKEGEKNKGYKEKIALLEKHFEEQNRQVTDLFLAFRQEVEKRKHAGQNSQLRAQFEEKKEEIKTIRKELFEKQLTIDTLEKQAEERALETPASTLQEKLSRALEELAHQESQEKRLLELVTHWSRT